MKKKGFTLIELLAVIIILAIVALIATPIVLDIIEDTRRSAFEQSALGYYKATEYIYNEMFLDGDTQDINFTFKDGVQTSSNSNYKLEVSGEKPKGGLIYLFKDGRIMLSIHNNKYCANVNHEGKVSVSEDINDCSSGITTVPEKCFIIQNKPLSTKADEWYMGYDTLLDDSEEWMTINYNMLHYDATIEGCPNEIDTLVIPSEVNGQVVEGLDYYGFAGADVGFGNSGVYIKRVFLPNSLKVIDEAAFMFSIMDSVIIPDSVIYIGNMAFLGSSISNIKLPSSLKYIGRGAFNGNQSLTSIEIPSGVTTIGSGAFMDSRLTSVIIPNSAINIEGESFNNNQLPDDQAFIYKRNEDGTIDTTKIVSYGGTKRDNIIIPNGVITIDEYAFSGNGLTSITIPSSVTTIGSGAFINNQLTSITIPSSVATIGSNAFWYNKFPNAKAITIEGNTTRFDSSWTNIGFPAK